MTGKVSKFLGGHYSGQPGPLNVNGCFGNILRLETALIRFLSNPFIIRRV